MRPRSWPHGHPRGRRGRNGGCRRDKGRGTGHRCSAQATRRSPRKRHSFQGRRWGRRNRSRGSTPARRDTRRHRPGTRSSPRRRSCNHRSARSRFGCRRSDHHRATQDRESTGTRHHGRRDRNFERHTESPPGAHRTHRRDDLGRNAPRRCRCRHHGSRCRRSRRARDGSRGGPRRPTPWDRARWMAGACSAPPGIRRRCRAPHRCTRCWYDTPAEAHRRRHA